MIPFSSIVHQVFIIDMDHFFIIQLAIGLSAGQRFLRQVGAPARHLHPGGGGPRVAYQYDLCSLIITYLYLSNYVVKTIIC